MTSTLTEFQALRALTPDGRLLLATRITRLFAYGFLSVVLVLYLARLGLPEPQIGLLLTLTLVGDTIISLWITTRADRIGRRRMLIVGASLMLAAGVLFAATRDFGLLLVAATVGVISPSGNEIGPFLSIEQAALAQIVPNRHRTQAFAWYNLIGSFATASGSLAAGVLARVLQAAGLSALGSYHAVLLGYALAGLMLIALFARLSAAIEISASLPDNRVATGRLGLHRSQRVVVRLSALFALDSFAGGFILQSILAYWFLVRFGVDEAALGGIFFGANILAGMSALLAARLAARIGLINTMVFTHLPSNLLLMLVPLMPDLAPAIGLLLIRFSISQMDVPTRQSYTMAVVSPDERSAAAGVTGVARTIGAALSPPIALSLLGSSALLNAPFFIAGGLKVVYDWLLYRSFKSAKPPEEIAPKEAR